jgi:hypothetical protein
MITIITYIAANAALWMPESGSTIVCAALLCGSVWQRSSASAAVCVAVCGSARLSGSAQCVAVRRFAAFRQRVVVRTVVCGSPAVHLAVCAAIFGSVRQHERQCVAVCALVSGCPAVRQCMCGAVCGRVW